MPPKHGHHGGGGGGGHHSTETSYGGGGADSSSGFDMSSIESFAHQHAEGSGDSSMFSSAMSMLQGKSSSMSGEGVDEDAMVQNHKSFFGSGDTGGAATSGGMGSAAAMQALKTFSGGSSSGSSQNEFVGMAMGQASKLFGEYIVPKLVFPPLGLLADRNGHARPTICQRQCG